MKNVKPNEINVYWRKQNNKQYAKDKPGLQVRKATDKYLSKKAELKEQMEGQDNWQDALLDDLVAKIREILSKKEV